MWKKHGKGHRHLGNYEYKRGRKGKRIFKLKNAKTGRESKTYRSPEHAKSEGWRKVS